MTIPPAVGARPRFMQAIVVAETAGVYRVPCAAAGAAE